MGVPLGEYGFYQHRGMLYSDGSVGARLQVVAGVGAEDTELRVCHEMMRRMERTVPGLVGAEQAFLRYRARDADCAPLSAVYVGRARRKGMLILSRGLMLDAFTTHHTLARSR